MRATKIIYLLFAAMVLNGATDGHAATRDFATESRMAARHVAQAAPARAEHAAPAGVTEVPGLPPLPSEADLRLDH